MDAQVGANQNTATNSADNAGRQTAEGLGASALARLIDASFDAVAVSSNEGRFVYANAAACEIYGYSLDELIGRDFLFNIPERGKARLAELAERWRTEPQSGRAILSIIRPSGEEREIELTTVPLSDDENSYPAAIFRDVTEERRLEREGTALMQIASKAAQGSSLLETMSELCRHLVGATGALAAAVVMEDPMTEQLRMSGVYGLGQGYMDSANRLLSSGIKLLSSEVIEQRQMIVRRNVRQTLLKLPSHETHYEFLQSAEWDTIVGVPMFYGDKVVGALLAYHHPEHEISETDLRFHTALAHQAALAVENARLLVQAQLKAALEERQRLARELHDSVSQALYSISLQARAARILLDRDVSRVAEPVDHVLSLSKAAMAEMRALIFELRPDALQEEGLLEALRKHAARVEAREGIAVDLLTPGDAVPRLSVPAEEALYRIAQEALHNVVKHAHATRVSITIGVEGDAFLLQISDNGDGFDIDQALVGHLGLGNMRQRAANLNANYLIESTPGQGTTVTVRVGAGSREPGTG